MNTSLKSTLSTGAPAESEQPQENGRNYSPPLDGWPQDAPVKFSIDLARVMELPRFGSFNAVCHVDLNLDGTLESDRARIQEKISRAFHAFQTCAQTVGEELARAKGTSGEGAADQLMSELMGSGEGREQSTDNGDHVAVKAPVGKTAAKAAPAKVAPLKPTPKPKGPSGPSEPIISLRNGIILGSAIFIVGLMLLWSLLSGPPSTATLASRALTASKLEERSEAAVELGLRKDGQVISHLRRLAQETKDPEILVIAINGLKSNSDADSLPILLAKMEDPDKRVRDAAFAAYTRIHLAMGIDDDVEFRGDDPPDVRGLALAKLKELQKKRDELPKRVAGQP